MRPGDSDSWAIGDEGKVDGYLVGTCTPLGSNYIAPMAAATEAIRVQAQITDVTFPSPGRQVIDPVDLSALRGLQSDNISDSDLSDIRRMEKDVKSQTIGTIGGLTQRSSSWVDECSQYCGTNLSGIKRVCTVALGEWSLSGNVMDIVGVFQSLPTTTKVPQRRVSVLRTEKPTASST